jgi:single-stranded DNA-binding protein
MILDLNLVVLCGKLAADPEPRMFDSGLRLIRYLVTTRAEHPKRRIDVVPVTLWDPCDELWANPGEKGDRFWACGSVQRRFWEAPDGRRSRIEVVAEQVTLKDVEDLEPVALA